MAAINTLENLWATKGIVGEREMGDCFTIMRMVTVMAMVMIATVRATRGWTRGGERRNGRIVCFYSLFSF